jgi:hypothetical protein
MRPSYRRIQQQRVEILGDDRLVFLGKGLWCGEAQDFGEVMGSYVGLSWLHVQFCPQITTFLITRQIRQGFHDITS